MQKFTVGSKHTSKHTSNSSTAAAAVVAVGSCVYCYFCWLIPSDRQTQHASEVDPHDVWYKILLYKQIVTLQEANSKFSHSSLCQGWIHQKNIVCLYLTFLHTAASARVVAFTLYSHNSTVCLTVIDSTSSICVRSGQIPRGNTTPLLFSSYTLMQPLHAAKAYRNCTTNSQTVLTIRQWW